MATKLKISNPYCSFGFKRHWLKQSRRKTSDIIFKADGYCKFDSCSVLVTLSMPTPTQASSYVVNVSYSANVHLHYIITEGTKSANPRHLLVGLLYRVKQATNTLLVDLNGAIPIYL